MRGVLPAILLVVTAALSTNCQLVGSRLRPVWAPSWSDSKCSVSETATGKTLLIQVVTEDRKETLPGATATITMGDRQVERICDNDGVARFTNLVVAGSSRLTVEMAGFVTFHGRVPASGCMRVIMAFDTCCPIQ